MLTPQTAAPITPAPEQQGRLTDGFSMVEVLVAGVILILLLGTYAQLSVQAERNNTALSAGTLAADSAALISQEITRGNPVMTPDTGHSVHLAPNLIASLSSGPTLRSQIAAAELQATVTGLGGNPPTYRVTVLTSSTPFHVTVVGPGGSE
ncbi:type IV pilus modification PilV family protein [Deinococcus multiflagellatus]|uniref:Type II secretion system protein n=1 Tax=Deinococcus multiflagellatus TaxID=1656887 RepID=A0ABW1ZT22_9DEIO|nr:type II secretion system protein [Deinococcus multiflagellatus]MBZ9714412.1 type II secretion system GspH family protein [Deinococcus multiflagellatus]